MVAVGNPRCHRYQAPSCHIPFIKSAASFSTLLRYAKTPRVTYWLAPDAPSFFSGSGRISDCDLFALMQYVSPVKLQFLANRPIDQKLPTKLLSRLNFFSRELRVVILASVQPLRSCV